MSTTLVPPTWYLVKPRGQTVRVFATIAQAATALVTLGPTPANVNAITGTRQRSLTEPELRELRQRVRAQRLNPATAHARQARPTSPVAIGRAQAHTSRRNTPEARRKDADEASAVSDQ